MIGSRCCAVLAVLFASSDAASLGKVSATIDVSNVTNPSVNPMFMGCHSDYGFEQTPRGFYAELVYGAAFGPGTMSVSPWAASAGRSIGLDTGEAFSSKPSMRIDVDRINGGGMYNRGIGGEGLSLVANKPYSFRAFIWQQETTKMFAELRDFTTNETLARQEFDIKGTGPAWGATWGHYNFSLTPSRGTTCEGIAPGSDPTIDCLGSKGGAHPCVRCGGELVVGIVGGEPGGSRSSIHMGYVSLMPGAWGLLSNKQGKPLPVLKSAADIMTSMGIKIMRSGGSVSQSMRWKDWRGPEWNRPSNQQVWGKSLLAGWGPFEVVDMCNALDITPVITLAYDTNDAFDWADLVEYAWGDATNTTWGKRRADDGHPEVYNITAFELGNEQYNPNFVDQVIAMEAKVKQLSASQPRDPVPPLQYIFPSNGGLSTDDMAAAIAAKLPIAQIMPDIHVGPAGAVEKARDHFKNADAHSFMDSAINMETNAGTHHLKRGLQEAADLIDFFTADYATTSRIFGRTASFCSGSVNQYDSWDQGMSFFLPNMTFLQPPGYVHQAIDLTWAEKTVAVEFDTGSERVPLAAQLQASTNSLVVRMVNMNNLSIPVALSLGKTSNSTANSMGWLSGADIDVYTIQGDDLELDNTPAEPTKIKLVQTKLQVADDATESGVVTVTLPMYSFVVLVTKMA
jgi:hypothetical protein